MYPLDEICLMCAKSSLNQLTNIFEKPELLQTFHNVIGEKIEKADYLPQAICFECVFNLNRVLEMRRMVKRNLLHFQVLNSYTKSPKSKLCHKIIDANIRNANSNGLIISEVHTQVQLDQSHFEIMEEEQEQLNTETSVFDNDQVMEMAMESETENPQRLLKPMYITSESVRDTESGGNIYHEGREYQCNWCYKTFRNHRYLEKHFAKSHLSKPRDHKLIHKMDKKTNFECPTCQTQYQSRKELQNHLKSHRDRFPCPGCKAEFLILRDLEWHTAICDGKRRAIESTGSNDFIRRTRSKSTILGQKSNGPVDFDDLRSEASYASEISIVPDSLYSEKMRNIKDWIGRSASHPRCSSRSHSLYNDSIGNDEDDRLSTISGASNRTFMSNYSISSVMTSVSQRSGISIRTNYTDKSKISTKSLLSEKAQLQNRTKTRAIAKEISKIDLELRFRTSDVESNIYKRNWRRRRLLERQKKKILSDKRAKNPEMLFCECDFATKSLREMMTHEIQLHNKLPLFTCMECKSRFTQQKYLMEHELTHDTALYLCVFCEKKCSSRHDLKFHLELHALKSYQCPACSFSFLNLADLDVHMSDQHEGHEIVRLPPSGILARIESGGKSVKSQKCHKNLPQKNDYRCSILIQENDLNFVKRRKIYDEYKIKLGATPPKHKPPEDEDDLLPNTEGEIIEHASEIVVENNLQLSVSKENVGVEVITLPTEEDICRYTPSPPLIDDNTDSKLDEDQHPHITTNGLSTPQPSLEDLGVFTTDFVNFTNVASVEQDTPSEAIAVSEGNQLDGENKLSPTTKKSRKRSKPKINLSKRVSKQLVPPKLRSKLECPIPSYESMFSQANKTTTQLMKSQIERPCRMT